MKPSFSQTRSNDFSGRYLVTFRENDEGAGLKMLQQEAGVRDVIHAADLDSQMAMQASRDTAEVFDQLNICCLSCADDVIDRICSKIPHSPIQSVEKDHAVYAIETKEVATPLSDPLIFDTSNDTWGRIATRAVASKYSGRGVRVAVLDTGVDRRHRGLSNTNLIQSKSYLDSSEAHDSNGHGTHCVGVLAGRTEPSNVPAFGIAPGVELFIGKILDNTGSGSVRQVLAGIDWAIRNGCRIVSMSLGADIAAPATMLEEAGRRALDAGTLIVAAAGNNARRSNHDFGFVVRPANSRFVMAVGAVDRELQVADFSSRSSIVEGGEVDIVAPGVEVFSSWVGAEKYRALSGTSMAVPFVAGIAALYVESLEVQGRQLWKTLQETASPLQSSSVDSGAGLVQAP